MGMFELPFQVCPMIRQVLWAAQTLEGRKYVSITVHNAPEVVPEPYIVLKDLTTELRLCQ